MVVVVDSIASGPILVIGDIVTIVVTEIGIRFHIVSGVLVLVHVGIFVGRNTLMIVNLVWG